MCLQTVIFTKIYLQLDELLHLMLNLLCVLLISLFELFKLLFALLG